MPSLRQVHRHMVSGLLHIRSLPNATRTNQRSSQESRARPGAAAIPPAPPDVLRYTGIAARLFSSLCSKRMSRATLSDPCINYSALGGHVPRIGPHDASMDEPHTRPAARPQPDDRYFRTEYVRAAHQAPSHPGGSGVLTWPLLFALMLLSFAVGTRSGWQK